MTAAATTNHSLIRCFNSHTRNAARSKLFVRVSVPTAAVGRSFVERVEARVFVRERRCALARPPRGVADSLTGRWPLVSIVVISIKQLPSHLLWLPLSRRRNSCIRSAAGLVVAAAGLVVAAVVSSGRTNMDLSPSRQQSRHRIRPYGHRRMHARRKALVPSRVLRKFQAAHGQ